MESETPVRRSSQSEGGWNQEPGPDFKSEVNMKKVSILTMVMAGILMFSMNVFADGMPSSGADSAALAATASGPVDFDLAKATFEKTCSKCHSLNRPLGKTKDRESWNRTTRRMSSRHKALFGKPIPEENRKAIVEYLLMNAGK